MAKNIFDDWESIREKGKLRFFFVNGVISYGLPMLIVMAFIKNPFAQGFASKQAILHVTIWPIAGLIFGIAMWYYGEYKFKKTSETKNDT